MKISTREVFTVLMAFTSGGGFMTITFLLTMIIVKRLQNTIYFSSLINSFYQYQPENIETRGKLMDNGDKNAMSQKQSLIQTLIDQISSRKSLNYGLIDVFKERIYACCCWRLRDSQRVRMKRDLFNLP